MDKKKNAFVKGHNVLKGKTSKPISKIKEVEKKKVSIRKSKLILNIGSYMYNCRCFIKNVQYKANLSL